MRKYFLGGCFIAYLLMFFVDFAVAQSIWCTEAADTEFVPRNGRVVVKRGNATGVLFQRMRWGTSSLRHHRLRWFHNNTDAGFEPDAIFDNSARYIDGLKGRTDWTSTLPFAYLDTQTFDDDTIKNVTVGSADADALQYSTSYWTFIPMNYYVNIGRLRTYVQRGRAIFDQIAHRWNVFGCNTPANGITTVPWQDFNLWSLPNYRFCKNFRFRFTDNGHQLSNCLPL